MFSTELQLARECALAAGEHLTQAYTSGSKVQAEQGKDIKLTADTEAEHLILNRLRRDSFHPILSEEAGSDSGFAAAELRWVVDPLDGTFNFSRRLPLCCVSIGLCRGDQPILGVIHDFLTRTTYAGVVGQGATRNDQPISVSATSESVKAMICTGFPSGRSYETASLHGFVAKVQRFKKVRLLGSAALSLAFVASGAVDAYHEDGINFWDVAAGLALVKAAGGEFTVRKSGADWQMEVFASNGRISAE